MQNSTLQVYALDDVDHSGRPLSMIFLLLCIVFGIGPTTIKSSEFLTQLPNPLRACSTTRPTLGNAITISACSLLALFRQSCGFSYPI